MKQKIYSLEKLQRILNKERIKGKKIILCHGVFDLLHIGHIKHFKEAKNFGDILVVTLTPDQFVNKGPNRPFFNEQLRLEAICFQWKAFLSQLVFEQPSSNTKFILVSLDLQQPSQSL